MTAVINTPDGIAYYRLAAAKARITLEAKGMKVSRGPSTRSLMAPELGLKRTDSHARFLEVIQDKMNSLLPPSAPSI